MKKFELATVHLDGPEDDAYCLGDGDHLLVVWFDPHDGEWWISYYVKADEGPADNYKEFR